MTLSNSYTICCIVPFCDYLVCSNLEQRNKLAKYSILLKLLGQVYLLTKKYHWRTGKSYYIIQKLLKWTKLQKIINKEAWNSYTTLLDKKKKKWKIQRKGKQKHVHTLLHHPFFQYPYCHHRHHHHNCNLDHNISIVNKSLLSKTKNTHIYYTSYVLYSDE